MEFAPYGWSGEVGGRTEYICSSVAIKIVFTNVVEHHVRVSSLVPLERFDRIRIASCPKGEVASVIPQYSGIRHVIESPARAIIRSRTACIYLVVGARVGSKEFCFRRIFRHEEATQGGTVEVAGGRVVRTCCIKADHQ